MSKARRPSQIYSLDTRIEAWEDGGRMCHYCDRPTPRPGTKNGYGTHFDHIVPVSHGGKHDKSNLVVCCKRCNTEKGNRPYEAFIKWRLELVEKQARRLRQLIDRMDGGESCQP